MKENLDCRVRNHLAKLAKIEIYYMLK